MGHLYHGKLLVITRGYIYIDMPGLILKHPIFDRNHTQLDPALQFLTTQPGGDQPEMYDLSIKYPKTSCH
jgi:hypothetical protein